MDPYFDRPFVKKSKKVRTFPIRNLGHFMTLVADGTLALTSYARSQGGVGRRSIHPISQAPPVASQVWPQERFPVPVPRIGTPFLRPAPVGIDERFIVAAPLGIDEGMIIPRGPVSPFQHPFIFSNPVAPRVPAR